MDFEELSFNVIDWANEKGIINQKESQARAQLAKMKEEFFEFEEAFEEFFNVDFKFNNGTQEYLLAKSEALRALDLELGDVLVTAIVTSACLNMNPVRSLELAWEKIKNRTGKVVNGQFVKN